MLGFFSFPLLPSRPADDVLAAFVEKIDDFLACVIDLAAGVPHFADGGRAGFNFRLEIQFPVDISSLDGSGADFVRLEIIAQDTHAGGGIDVRVVEVDVDSGVIFYRVGVNIDVHIVAESRDDNLVVAFVIKGAVKRGVQFFRGLLHERDEQIGRVDHAFFAAVAVNQKMFSDVAFHDGSSL